MNDRELASFKKWFAAYTASFGTPVREDQRNISVKQDHTHQVCLNALQIGRGLQMSGEELLLAETIALFHDIGRFPQYKQFKTFDDAVSVNHAALGAKVLREQRVLDGLPKRDQNLIIHTVALHNVFALPEGLDEATLLFVNLVRDADKLDILRVVIEYIEQERGERAEAVALGLPDEPGYSPGVLESLEKGELARKSDLRTLNDFKLLQLTWLYDLNYGGSLRMVRERGYVDKLQRLLPPDDRIRRAINGVRTYVDGNAEKTGLPAL